MKIHTGMKTKGCVQVQFIIFYFVHYKNKHQISDVTKAVNKMRALVNAVSMNFGDMEYGQFPSYGHPLEVFLQISTHTRLVSF